VSPRNSRKISELPRLDDFGTYLSNLLKCLEVSLSNLRREGVFEGLEEKCTALFEMLQSYQTGLSE
jgi:hypothetical protein